MAFIHLVYVSRRTPALGPRPLRRLVEEASRRNHARNITGVLLCAGDQLMQLLEGEDAVVDPLFDRIRRDARHQDVQLLLHKPVTTRLFPESRMELAELDRRFRLDRARLSGLIDYVRATDDTRHYTVETRVLLADFHQQLGAQ